MLRIASTLAFTLTISLAGCKQSTAPLPNGDSSGKDELKVEQPPKKTETRKPDQPPMVGERDVAKADRQELIECLGHEDMATKIEASDRLLAQGPDAIPILIEALDDENYHVRAGAVFSLGRFGPEAKAASAKLETLAEEDDWEVVRDAARFALESIKGN